MEMKRAMMQSAADDGISTPTVSILLLTKNGMPDIAECLKIVHEQRGIGSMEVIVVDSGSTDGSLAAARSFHVRLEQIPSETFHHARTRNLAATLARGQILVFLSQDAVPTSDRWLETMLSNFSDPSVGAVYGRQLPKPGSSREREDVLAAVYGQTRIIKDPSRPNGSGLRFYHFSDVNCAIRHSVWSRVRFPEE